MGYAIIYPLMEFLSDWFSVSPATIFWCSLFLLTWAGVFAGAYGYHVGSQLFRDYRSRRLKTSGDVMDDKARKILEHLGFSVENDYAKHTMRVFQDGQPLDLPVQPDIIVSKGGKSYVVDIMQKNEMSQVSDPKTRRQLLEYFVAYKPDGVLLMDMENKRIHDIRFDLLSPELPEA